jgi:hypothetical protein
MQWITLGIAAAIVSLTLGCGESPAPSEGGPADPAAPRQGAGDDAEGEATMRELTFKHVEMPRGLDAPTRTVVRAGEAMPEQLSHPDPRERMEGDEPAMAIIWALGQKPTLGYDVTIRQVTLHDEEDGAVLTVTAKITEPGRDEMVGQAITYPTDVVITPDVDFTRVEWRTINGDSGSETRR